jgi:uncharacterized RDD family membrane protein YckC
MKTVKNLLFILIGSMMILGAFKLLLIDGSNEYAKILGLLTFGVIFIYPSLKKDSKTESEKFTEKENIDIPIWWKRLIGFIIDYIIIAFIFSTTLFIIEKIYGVRISRLYNPLLLLSPFIVFYYGIQELLFNTSIGKMVFKLKVVSAITNDKPTLMQVVIRSFSRLIPIDIFFYIVKRPIGLHDIISKTVVIKKN